MDSIRPQVPYKSIIAYDGTAFQGYQRQLEGIRTVQSEFEAALRRIGWQGAAIHAAGRTDSGVHASGQVVAFELGWGHSTETLTRALNANLPSDIAVQETRETHPGFHPRFEARSRIYRYRLLFAPQPDPLRERFAWRLWPQLPLARLQEAAQQLVGAYDFGAFGSAPIVGGHTKRRVMQAAWQGEPDGLVFTIEAEAFLYHMVRRLVAALVSVGQEKTELRAIAAHLLNPDQRWMGAIAPAHGLCLVAVKYDEKPPGK